MIVVDRLGQAVCIGNDIVQRVAHTGCQMGHIRRILQQSHRISLLGGGCLQKDLCLSDHGLYIRNQSGVSRSAMEAFDDRANRSGDITRVWLGCSSGLI